MQRDILHMPLRNDLFTCKLTWNGPEESPLSKAEFPDQIVRLPETAQGDIPNIPLNVQISLQL